MPYIMYTKAFRDLSDKKNFDSDVALGLNINVMEQVLAKFELVRSERESGNSDDYYHTAGATLVGGDF